MQKSPKPFNLAGLVVMLGLLAMLAGIIVMVALPGIRAAAWALLLLGVLLLCGASIIEYRQVSRAVTGKRGKFAAGATAMTAIFIGIILLVNAISIGNYHRFDFTHLAQFTLTSQTRDVLSKLDKPVQAIGFFSPNDSYEVLNYATAMLTEYQNYTTQLTVKYVDPDQHPDEARNYGITQYQTVVFEGDKGRRLVAAQEIVEEAEHVFTSAILEVTGVSQKKVYFLTGHGEADIESTAPGGYNKAKSGLRDNLYQVESLDLLRNPAIPKDTAVLVIAGPQAPLVAAEIDIIGRYLADGGSVMFLLNPDSSPELKPLLASMGVDIEPGTVIDPSSYAAPNLDSPSVPRTRNYLGLSTIYFPGATAIFPKESVTDMETLALAWTSADAWLEKDYKSGAKPEFNADVDRKGSLALAVLISSATGKSTNLVVVGDSDFAANQHFYNANNSDLFLNAVNVLTATTSLISIDRKVVPFRRLVVDPETVNFINYSSIGLLPLLVLIFAGIIWWRRR